MNRIHWLVPAFASLAFLVFSLVVVSREGLSGLFVLHQQSGWQLQIFIDLVISAIVAFLFVAPVAQRLGMRTAPWLVLILLTGSIALLALVARVRYLQAKGTGLGADGVSPARTVA